LKNYKIRWQPERSLAIIYWSVTLIFLFLSLTFILERAEVHWKSMLFMVIFLLLFYLGYRRAIIVHKNGLQINYARFWKTDYLPFNQIESIQISVNFVTINLKKQKLELSLRKKQVKLFWKLLPKEVTVYSK